MAWAARCITLFPNVLSALDYELHNKEENLKQGTSGASGYKTCLHNVFTERVWKVLLSYLLLAQGIKKNISHTTVYELFLYKIFIIGCKQWEDK